MTLDADAVARAVVAACLETGDDPVDVASGKMKIFTRAWSDGSRVGGGVRHPRARFLAYRALMVEFPDTKKMTAARCVGARRPLSFTQQALVAVNRVHALPLGRVCAAVRREVAPPPPPEAVAPRPTTRLVLAPPRTKRAYGRFDRVGPSELAPRRRVAPGAASVTAELCGDPPPSRSALADAAPWVPYEQRARDLSRPIAAGARQANRGLDR